MIELNPAITDDLCAQAMHLVPWAGMVSQMAICGYAIEVRYTLCGRNLTVSHMLRQLRQKLNPGPSDAHRRVREVTVRLPLRTRLPQRTRHPPCLPTMKRNGTLQVSVW